MPSLEKLNDILRKAFDLETSGELAESIRLFKQASKLGSNDARSMLGTIFDDIATPRSPTKAVYWYRLGVKGGDGSSAWNLAMHYSGLGRKRWYRYWLETANKMGYATAASELRTRISRASATSFANKVGSGNTGCFLIRQEGVATTAVQDRRV